MMHTASQSEHEERLAALEASVSLIDFVIACNDSSDEAVLAVQKHVSYIATLCQQAVAHDPQFDAQQFTDAASRGAAFLASNGRGST